MLNPNKSRRQLLGGCMGLVTLILIGTMLGCAVVATKAPTGASPDPGHGIVLVRVSTVGLINMNTFSANARPIGKEETINFNGWSMASDGYWTKTASKEEKGQLVALQIPEGQYEFFSISAMSSAGLATITGGSTKTFSYSFESKSGEVVYLGELLFNFDQDRLPKSGSTSNVPYRILVRDNRTQDFQEATRLIPGLSADRIVVRLLSGPVPSTPR